MNFHNDGRVNYSEFLAATISAVVNNIIFRNSERMKSYGLRLSTST